jgi:hypothetical protein
MLSPTHVGVLRGAVAETVQALASPICVPYRMSGGEAPPYPFAPTQEV